jgi:hypothetical protein
MSKTLPKLKHPTFVAQLPISKQKVTYRAFTVQEEKNVLVAAEAESNAIGSIIAVSWDLVDICTFGKLNKDTLPAADFEWLLLQIRSKSVGEIVEGSIVCDSCGEKSKYDLNLNNLVVEGEWKTKDITIQPGYIISVGYPTAASALETVDMIAGRDERLLATCIKTVTVDNEVFKQEDVEMIEMVDLILDLPSNIYNKLVDFIQTGPRLVYRDTHTCPKCGHVQDVRIEGFDNFFV